MYQRIRDLREDADLRQQDMAEYLQCTQVCYSYYESGKRDIPTDVLIRIARYYDVSVDYLLGLIDRREAYPALVVYVASELRVDRKAYAPERCQERDGHRQKAGLPSGAESASGSARDVDALRMACVMAGLE